MGKRQNRIYGYNAIAAYLQTASSNAVLYLLGAKVKAGSRLAELERAAGAKGIQVRLVDASEMARIGASDSRASGTQGGGAMLVTGGDETIGPGDRLAAYLARLERTGHRSESHIVLVLDGITDPHNLGAVLRSADMFAVDLVVVPSRRAAHETETVARVSSGASAFVDVAEVVNIVRAIKALKAAGFWVYGAEMTGSPVSEARLNGRVALVLGSEGKGLSRLAGESCDALVAIPTSGHIDSLNVSVSAGILMYEVRRQVGFSGSGALR